MEPLQKKTLILGASDNPVRYSYLALNRLRAHGHPVVAIGKRKVTVKDVSIQTEKEPFRESTPLPFILTRPIRRNITIISYRYIPGESYSTRELKMMNCVTLQKPMAFSR